MADLFGCAGLKVRQIELSAYVGARAGDETGGREKLPDPEGQKFGDLGPAYDEAVGAAREIVARRVLPAKRLNGERFEIADAEGKVLLIVPFATALPD